MRRVLFGVALVVGQVACSGSGGGDSAGDRAQAGTAQGSGGVGVSETGAQQFGNAGTEDAPPQATPPGPTTDPGPASEAVVEACRKLESRAEGVPVLQSDIIVVLDNSGSMVEEIDQVRDNLNGFAAALADSEVDPRVVMISAALDTTAWFGVCIPAPLGSGSCPDDDNPPTYTHVTQHVLDSDPPIVTDIFVQDTALLDHLMYSFSQWRDVLRPGVTKNIVVISDHDAVLSPDYFTQWMDRQHEFARDGWRLNAVVCLDDSCAEPELWGGRRVGSVYTQLAESTGGVTVQITSTTFDAIFQTLATDIVDTASPMPCDWGIPEPPDGKTLDPDQVNVRYIGADGSEQTILGLGAVDDCEITGGGWYYDDPAAPTRIAVCEQTCRVMGIDPQAKVQVEFGCERQSDPRVD